jgi:hypothetical protein
MTISAGWAEEAVRAHAGAEHLTREQVLERIAGSRGNRIREERIALHGAGGRHHTLIEAVPRRLRNPLSEPPEDAAR